MVPFIDVVLVLLIIFMITAPILQSGSKSMCRRRRPLRKSPSSGGDQRGQEPADLSGKQPGEHS
jgi:biopolymer transport protein ExbD